MYRCESWTINKAECQTIDAFELWCWRRLLRVPWTTRRSNQSILKEISPECSLEGLMLKLKLQDFGRLMWRTGRDPDVGKDWEQEKGMTEDEMVGWQSLTWWTWVWESFGSWWWTGKPGVLQSMGSPRVGHNWGTELNWVWSLLFLMLPPALLNWFTPQDGFCAALRFLQEKATATHSSSLAWKIPWVEGPGRLQFMGLRRVRYDWTT